MLTTPKAKIALQSKSGDASFDCGSGEKLLFAGLAQGLALPYECATGTCGTCKARITEGAFDVAWPEAPGAAKLKRDRGDVLLCQTTAGSDCSIRIAANVAQPTTGPLPMYRKGVVADAKLLTADVIEITIELSSPMVFQAGQFVVLEVAGVRGGRAYSMVNFDDNTSRLVFVIKRKVGGAFGNWLFDNDPSGAEVSLFGALGRATWGPAEDRDILAIAGGSGIAGIMSILAHATRAGHFAKRRGHVFFGVRTRADAFYTAELGAFVAASGGNLEVVVALSHEDVGEGETMGSVRLASGFVHEAARQIMAGRYGGDLTAYLAGPTPMVDGALRMLLTEARLTPDRIRFDKFS